MRFKSSEAIAEVITSMEEPEEAMEGGDDGECERDLRWPILWD